MLNDYTMEATDYIDDLAEMDTEQIWESLEPRSGDALSGLWKDKLEALSQEYRMSSRFALMRILHNRVYAACKASGSDPEAWPDQVCASREHFKADVQGKWVVFSQITMDHALTLTPQENEDYVNHLIQIASQAEEPEPGFHAALIARAWYDTASANHLSDYLLSQDPPADPKKARVDAHKANKRAFEARLTREEALRLGHILDFSYSEMQWFLLRIFDTGDSFRLNRSDDLIEAYCFLLRSSWQHAQALKQAYRELTAGIEKNDDSDRSRNWTARIAGDLSSQIEIWKDHLESCDASFLDWLKRQAPGLDLPSRTAARLYRELAAYAYALSIAAEDIPEEADFLDILQALCRQEQEGPYSLRYLHQKGSLSEDLCRQVAKVLLRDNKERSEALDPDGSAAWSMLTTRDNGVLSASYGIVNESRTRVRDILTGQAEAEKGDMLYLLWYTINLLWYGSELSDPEDLYCRILDLKDAAYTLLDAAGLSPFYPVHLLEMSMLLSTVYGGKGSISPTEVYAQMLQSVKSTRTRSKGSQKHDLPARIAIVRHYRSSGMTLEECANQYSISPKTLSAWQKELAEAGQL